MRVDDIIAQARQRTGLHELGDPFVLRGLEVLVEATNAEARLSEAGVQRWEGTLVDTLANRLRVVDYAARHLNLLKAPIERPTFVFGLPRTGTTLTINLLSADPGRRCLLRWEALDSAPPAGVGRLHDDPRCVAQQQRLDQAVKYMPQIAAAHYEDADSPTECQYPMALSFCSQIFDSMVNIPSYRRWFFATSYLPAFEFHKQVLQVLQENNKGHWTLKNPWHPLYLDDLKTVYPDAQLVMTHRDPAEVVGSACSLIRLVRPMFSETVDLREIAAQSLRTFDLMIERQDAFRQQHGEGSIFDIRYADQLEDPIAVMRRLYDHFDTPLTDKAVQAMRALLADNPQGKHGKHAYDLAEFGLTKDGVRSHFKSYCERFDI